MNDTLTNAEDAGSKGILDYLNDFLNIHLFSSGDTKFTVGTLLLTIGSLVLLIIVAEWIRKKIINRVFNRYKINVGVGHAVGTIIKYVIVTIGFFAILQTNGINLSTFGILLGALGVGIGFGLQNVVNNFISGLIILFEQPIKVGDRVEVDDIAGDIVSISARSTTIVTNDNISIIVPNSSFVDSNVINWSHNDRNVRFNIPVGVSYKEDPENVKRILLEVARANEGVLEYPKPDVLFDEYDESSINFILLVWSTEYINRPPVLKSQLYYEIFRRFREEGVEIPFPQRDLHLKSGFEKLAH